MNFGRIAKVHAFHKGAKNDMTDDDFEYAAGEKPTAKRLEKANARLSDLRDQLTRKWKLDED